DTDAWLPPDGTFLDATFNNPNTVWSSAEVAQEGDWTALTLPTAIAQMLISGAARGIAVADEAGQLGDNIDVASRQQPGAEPYLVISGEPGKAASHARPELTLSPAAATDFAGGAID